MPLEVNGQQGLLHHVLGLIGAKSGAAKPAPRNRADRRRQARQQPVVGSSIAAVGRAHQVAPIDLALAHSAFLRVPTPRSLTLLLNYTYFLLNFLASLQT